MKFILSTQEFNYLMNKLQGVVSAKAAIPILANVLLEARGNEILMTATDLTVGIQCRTEAKVIQEGATTLPMKTVASLVRTLTAANMEVSTNEQHITEILAGSSRFKLHGMGPEEFPSLPEIDESIRLEVPREELRSAFHRTAFAVSREDSRYVLTGVWVHLMENEAVFVGTDGKRLARYPMRIPSATHATGEYVVPVKAVEEILRNLNEDEETVSLFFMPDKLGIRIGSVTLITKLLSGEYPDVQRVIPQALPNEIPIHREELISLLRQISLFTADTAQSVRFHFLPGELKLASNSMEIGEGKVTMPVSYKGPEMQAAFNPRFFREILEHSDKERIILGMTDPYNPALIRDESAEGVAGESPIFILMPMRLES